MRRRKAVSPLLATIILIAVVVSAGLILYATISGLFGTFSRRAEVQVTNADLVVAGDNALLIVSLKNTGTAKLAGAFVSCFDDSGKQFKLALPPAEPGQASGNTLVIPLGVADRVLDGSGNGNHGTVCSGAMWADGKYGKALSFDGVDDYVAVPDSDSFDVGSEIAMAVWLYPHNPTAGYTMFIEKQTPGFGFWLVPSGRLYAEVYHPNWQTEGYTSVLGNTPLQPNNWYHCAAVYKQNEYFRIYLNGVLNAAVAAPDKAVGVNSNPLLLAVQGWMGSGNAYYNGIMDEVRIYNRALIAEESKFANENPGLPLTDGLVLWLPLDEGSSSPFSFTAGKAYAITVTAYTLDGSVFQKALTVRAGS